MGPFSRTPARTPRHHCARSRLLDGHRAALGGPLVRPGNRARPEGCRWTLRPRSARLCGALLRQRQLRRTNRAERRAGRRGLLEDRSSAPLRHRRSARRAAVVLQRPGTFQLLSRERPRQEHAAFFGDVAGFLACGVAGAADLVRVVAGGGRPDQRRRYVLRADRTRRTVDRRRDPPARPAPRHDRMVRSARRRAPVRRRTDRRWPGAAIRR